MKIILLSGGSGRRLWPLSNGARAKQFLRLLPAPDGSNESMIQRVVRQINSAGIHDEIIVTTVAAQRDSITTQLGDKVTLVTEPARRRTAPAILLAAEHLAECGTSHDEPVIIVPCDTFAPDVYFQGIRILAQGVERNIADILLVGVTPTYPSAKYGYILPGKECEGGFREVERFIERPDVREAESLIEHHALWNGGVFATKLGTLLHMADSLLDCDGFGAIEERYDSLPAISFDSLINESKASLAMLHYSGEWKDLGTWNTLIDHVGDHGHGNVYSEECTDSYIINELDTPLVCIGADNLVIAASHDGILVSRRQLSENVKRIVSDIDARPMYEERRWGEYKVVDSVKFADGYRALTKQLTLRPGCSISYQKHTYRDEVWTFVDGEGEIVLDGELKPVQRGETIIIPKGQWHALRAKTALTFIEVQSGTLLIEEDIERQPYTWY